MNYKIKLLKKKDECLFSIEFLPNSYEAVTRIRYLIGEQTPCDIYDYYVDENSATIFAAWEAKHYCAAVIKKEIERALRDFDKPEDQKVPSETHKRLKEALTELDLANRKIMLNEETIRNLCSLIDLQREEIKSLRIDS